MSRKPIWRFLIHKHTPPYRWFIQVAMTVLYTLISSTIHQSSIKEKEREKRDRLVNREEEWYEILFGWIIQKISREEKKYGYSTICELIGDMFNFSWRVRSSLGRNESTIVTDKQTIGQGFYTDAALLLLLLPASSCTFNMLYMALVINTKSNIMAVSRLHAVSVQHVCVCVCLSETDGENIGTHWLIKENAISLAPAVPQTVWLLFCQLTFFLPRLARSAVAAWQILPSHSRYQGLHVDC